MQTSNLIQLKSVSLTYGAAYPALKDINLTVAAGEHLAVVGSSGSGKSSLLNMITGIDHPTRGEVEVGGTKVHTLAEGPLALWRGRTVGIVFQFFQLIPNLTILENLLLPMEFVNVVPKAERRGRALSLLEQTGIGPQAGKLPAELSGGEQQRAAIARALANDPPLLVADEPTGNLDSRNAEKVLAIFRAQTQAGKTVVVVTHERNAGAEFGRVVTLRDGAIISDERSRP
ncbi:MAG TPA: ABC transporter ATP-binding protein [Thermoanaerobaculia bacterium]|jgi:putative ABC transport system ATP-binding protein|nr:ABC transporter ATP-binding protein [Thermoanaerobaculia bacterium]